MLLSTHWIISLLPDVVLRARTVPTDSLARAKEGQGESLRRRMRQAHSRRYELCTRLREEGFVRLLASSRVRGEQRAPRASLPTAAYNSGDAAKPLSLAAVSREGDYHEDYWDREEESRCGVGSRLAMSALRLQFSSAWQG